MHWPPTALRESTICDLISSSPSSKTWNSPTGPTPTMMASVSIGPVTSTCGFCGWTSAGFIEVMDGQYICGARDTMPRGYGGGAQLYGFSPQRCGSRSAGLAAAGPTASRLLLALDVVLQFADARVDLGHCVEVAVVGTPRELHLLQRCRLHAKERVHLADRLVMQRLLAERGVAAPQQCVVDGHRPRDRNLIAQHGNRLFVLVGSVQHIDVVPDSDHRERKPRGKVGSGVDGLLALFVGLRHCVARFRDELVEYCRRCLGQAARRARVLVCNVRLVQLERCESDPVAGRHFRHRRVIA